MNHPTSGVQADASQLLDIVNQARASIQELCSTKEERSAAKAARLAAKGLEEKPKTAKQLAKEEAQAKQAAKERAGELCNMAVRMASWGLKEGLERARSDGADLSASNGACTPAIAAISAGHKDLALWLMARPEHEWSVRRHPRSTCEMMAAVALDDDELLAKIDQLDPALLDERSHTAQENETRADDLMLQAMRDAPRCAAWVASKRPQAAKRWSEKSRGAGYWVSGLAALRAREAGLGEEAKLLLSLCEPGLMNQEDFIHGSGGLARQFLQHAAINDDAEGLAWLFESLPGWAARLLEGVDLFDFRYAWLNPYYREMDKAPPMKLAKARLDAANGRRGDKPGLRVALAAWLGREDAQDCLDFILGMEGFKRQLVDSQNKPEQFLWEAAYQITDPTTVGKLARAGFDFDKRVEEDWSYMALVIYADAANGKWLEMMGTKYFDQGAPRESDGKTPFDLASMGREAPKLLSKWRMAFDKAAIRAGTGRSSTKANQASKGRARL